MTGKFFVMDAETDGIYGNVLSIAVKVIDRFKAVNHFYGAVRISVEDITTPWVKENVYPYLDNAETFFDSEEALLEAFWEFYMKYHSEYTVICDVPYPVEDGIFRKCIFSDRKNREAYSPFPMLDVESMLQAKGYGRLSDRKSIAISELVNHDAMNDVDIIIKILEGLI